MRSMSIVPFGQLDPLSQVPSIFTSLFDDFDRTPRRHKSSKPGANITKEDSGYRIDLAVPGYDRDDIDVSIKDNTLIIEADITNDSTDNYHTEFSVSSFRRQWTLPQNVDVDGIEASHKNGILTLSIPSTKENHRKIEIGLK